MILLYNLGIFLYRFAISIYSLSSSKAKLWIDGRRNIFEKISKTVVGTKPIWFHCASLGEFEQGRPVIEQIKKQYPTQKILLTFFSPSGYEIRKNYPNADYVFYLPLDTAKNAEKFIKLICPTIAIFIKYEFWYHYIKELKRCNIPVFVISAIFRPKQIFFKSYGKWYLDVLKKIDCLFVQNTESIDILKAHGITQAIKSGDTRFDRVSQIASNAKTIEAIEIFKDNKPVFIAGSSWEQDEAIIAKFINESSLSIKYIFAPHEIDEHHVEQLCKQIKVPVVRFSQFTKDKAANAKVLIIDNIGMLSSAYKYADVAYVGGAFKTGLHNILEPATFGIPVICGPTYNKFGEAVELVKLGGLISICNFDGFAKTMTRFFTNEPERLAVGLINKEYINSQIGATEQIMIRIKQTINIQHVDCEMNTRHTQ